METFLTFLPLIMVTVYLGFGCFFVIDIARRSWREPGKGKVHRKAGH